MLTAAEREAATIVTKARGEIRIIILTARRDLLELAMQVKTIPNIQDESLARQALVPGLSETAQPATVDSLALPAEDGVGTAERLLDARRDLLHVLDEARPDLELLRDDASARRLHAQPTAIGEPPELRENTDLLMEDEPTVAAQPPIAEAEYQSRPRRPAKMLVTAFTMISLVLLLGAVWWDRIEQAIFDRPKQAAHAASPSAPLQSAERPASVALPPVESLDATVRASVTPTGAERPSPPPGDSAGSTTDGSLKSENPPASRVDRAGPSSAVAKATPSAPTTPSVVTTPVNGRLVMDGPTPLTETMPEGGAQLTSVAERWLDAYYQRDAGSMASVATHDLKISDQRASGERPPPGLGDVGRVLEQVKVQFVGNSAILTAKMIEQTEADQPRQYLSWISQMWIRETGQWRLMEVRIISDAKLK